MKWKTIVAQLARAEERRATAEEAIAAAWAESIKITKRRDRREQLWRDENVAFREMDTDRAARWHAEEMERLERPYRLIDEARKERES